MNYLKCSNNFAVDCKPTKFLCKIFSVHDDLVFVYRYFDKVSTLNILHGHFYYFLLGSRYCPRVRKSFSVGWSNQQKKVHIPLRKFRNFFQCACNELYCFTSSQTRLDTFTHYMRERVITHLACQSLSAGTSNLPFAQRVSGK